MDTGNLEKSDCAIWRYCAKQEASTPWGRGVGSAHLRCLLGVCLGTEAGGIHTESIFLMPSISFMRMDYAAGVIYTNGDDKS